MTDEPEDPDDALHDAHRASSSSAVLVAITVAFGAVAVADASLFPVWVLSAWFIVVVPLALLVMFVFRRRYRLLLEARAGVSATNASISDDS